MDKRLQNLNQGQIAFGIALTASAAFSAYNIKSNMEINKKLDSMYEDIEKIKQFINDNNRKNNISINNLGKKIEDIQTKFVKIINKDNNLNNNNLNNNNLNNNNLNNNLNNNNLDVEDDDVDDLVLNFLKN